MAQIEKDRLVKVVNRNNGTTGYAIPEMRIRRQFAAGEAKELKYEELEQLSFQAGGKYVIENLLKIEDKEVAAALLGTVEPEYEYTMDDIKRLLTTGSLDEFLDCLDFAPASVIEQIKDLAVDMPLQDLSKIEAIKEKTHFDVLTAIKIKETKYDGDEDAEEKPEKARRTVPTSDRPKRRVIITE